MSSAYDICVVEACPETRRSVVETLRGAGFSLCEAGDGIEGWGLITTHAPKVILSGWYLPGLDGLELCRNLREHPERKDTFFVLMTAQDRDASKTLALCSGADDYLPTPIDAEDLIARMRVGVRLYAMQEKLRQAAITDGLTGLYNHDHLHRILETEMNRCRRYGGSLSFLMVDLDYFKAVNDTYGHLAGNDVLQQVAVVLRMTVRDVDVIARFGGDEFAIVAPESTLESAAVVADRIRTAVAENVHLPGEDRSMVGVSVGVSCTDDLRVKSAADLLDLADQAMYVAKRTGRNRVATAREVGVDQSAPEAVFQIEEIDSLRKRVAMLSAHAKDMYLQSIASLVQVLDEKDPYAACHSSNVSSIASEIGFHLGCDEGLVAAVRNAGLLHDIGKVGIPDAILLKPATLTPLEQAVMQQVPLISARIIDHLRILESERQIIRHQREHYDGSGVPDGLEGDAIPIGSRIVLVADAFDAMTTDRVYRLRRSIDEALAELQACAGRQFDARVVEGLRELVHRDRPAWQRRVEETTQAFPLLTATESS